MNNFNLMRVGQLMGGIGALQGAYDLCISAQMRSPERKRFLHDRGKAGVVGGAILAGVSFLIPLRISYLPTTVQPLLSKNLKAFLTLAGLLMLVHGVDQVYKASQERNDLQRTNLAKEGIGHALYGSAALAARVWS